MNFKLIKQKELCFIASLSLGVAFSFLTGCQQVAPHSGSPRATKMVASTDWPPVYTDAVKDALNPEPSEISTNLIAVVPSNKNLKWKEINGVNHVLVATLASDASWYAPYLGKSYNTGSHNIWITTAPELQNLCLDPQFGGNDLDMRLREILGLTPTATVTSFVEFWVQPSDLFRPAPDNEITDNTAGLSLPDDVSSWYRLWFNSLRSSQYFQSNDPAHDAYPWTQLGYTYDWGGDPQSSIGLSEFVIKTNANVIVNGIYTIDQYCGRSGN